MGSSSGLDPLIMAQWTELTLAAKEMLAAWCAGVSEGRRRGAVAQLGAGGLRVGSP
jgi:hypothetical protein